MSDLNIEGTLKTPTISFSEKEKRLLIEGRSTPEDPIQFYEPLISKLKDFVKSPIGKMEIDFKLEYFNTTSSLVILDVLKHLQSVNTVNNEVVINWHYDKDDEDLLEVGEDYSTMLKFPINLIVNPN